MFLVLILTFMPCLLPKVKATPRRTITLVASQARTATLTTGAFDVGPEVTKLVAYLSVTAASGTSPTLDVKIQDSPDGNTWYDIGSGTGSGTGLFVQATAATTQVKDITTRNFGRYIRAVNTVGGTTPSFTFSVQVVVY